MVGRRRRASKSQFPGSPRDFYGVYTPSGSWRLPAVYTGMAQSPEWFRGYHPARGWRIL